MALMAGGIIGSITLPVRPDLVIVPFGQDVRRGPHTNLQPDLLVERKADIDLDSHVAVAPLTVGEMVSPSSRRFDLGIKRDAYTEAGIPSYWVVHPAEDWVQVYELAGGAYELVASAHAEEAVRVERPFPVAFRPTDLLARFR